MNISGAPDDMAKELIQNSYNIVKEKYTKKRR